MTAPRPHHLRGNDSGIVLVELLAALSIVAIMAALMAGMLGQMRTVARIGADAAIATELAAAADHVARTISAARPVALPGTGGGEAAAGRAPVLVGTADGLRFVAVTRRGFATFGLSEVTIAPDGARGDLTLIQTLRPAHRTGGAPIASARVAEGLAAASFAYIDIDGTPRPGWTAERLPAGVRITLARRSGDRVIRAEVFAATD